MKKTSTASRASASVGADDHALAGRQAVGLEHRRVGGAGELLERLLAAAQQHVGGGRHAGLLHQLLGEGLRALQLGRRARSARRRGSPASSSASTTPATSAASGPIATRSTAALARRGDDRLDVLGADLGQALGVGGDPGVAGRAEQLGSVGRARERPHDRVLAPAAADDQDLQARRA